MKRREFITLVGGAAAAWPVAARGQQARKLPTIGLLGSTSASIAAPWIGAFVQRLLELGWVEGRTVAIHYRWADGRSDRSREIAAEFTRLNVDVIVTSSTQNVITAKQATSTIPIVFASIADPLSTGIVASLPRPGGNATGLSVQFTDLASKRLELLRETLPSLRRLAIIVNPASPGSMLEMREVHRTAGTLDLEVAISEIRQAQDIARILEALNGRADALYVCSDALMSANRVRIVTMTLGMRLPTIYPFREYVLAGGLMSYGANFPDLWRRAADYVDKILRGAKPADIPVEQPTKFDLVINLIAAKAIGLTVPPMLLARADEVIE